MKYQIAEQQIAQSDFYRNLDTTSLAKLSTATCPHRHVLQVIHSKLTAYAVDLADGKLTIDEVEEQFYLSVMIEVGFNA